MAQVTLKVNIGDGAPARGHYRLLTREVAFPEGLPLSGEQFMFLCEESSDASLIVGKRWWALDGTVTLELQEITYLPTESGEEWIQSSHAFARSTDQPWESQSSWRDFDDEGDDGTLFDLLFAAGWQEIK